jgi:hypothetical protein
MNRTEIEKQIAKELNIPESRACVVGSTLICGKGNDVDVLCLVPSEDVVTAAGYVADVEVHYNSPLRSFRKQGVNLIAVTDPAFFFAEVAIAHAVKVAAHMGLNMTERDARIVFHSDVREQVLLRMCFEPEFSTVF